MRTLIAENSWRLAFPEPCPVNRDRLLAALCMQESNGGRNRQPNWEPSFSKGGAYFSESLHARTVAHADPVLRDLLGLLAASSFGPFQVMYPVACELGFSGLPWELADPRINILFAIRYINVRCIPKLRARDEMGLVEQVADGYNSGNPVDRRVPRVYIDSVMSHYRRADLFGHLEDLRGYYRPVDREASNGGL